MAGASGIERPQLAKPSPIAATPIGDGSASTSTLAPSAGSHPAVATSRTDPEFVFRPNFLWQALFLLVSFVCFGIVAIAVHQYLRASAIRPPKPGTVLALTVLFGGGGLAMAYAGLRLVGMKYLIFPDHFVHAQNGETTTYTWDQIRAVIHSVHPGWQKYEIATRKGRVLTLTSQIWKYTQLGKVIAERAAQVQLPGAVQQIESGLTLKCGPISADRSGVVCFGQALPWEHLQSLSFGFNNIPQGPDRRISNMVHLHLNDIHRVELGTIPNYKLFEMLVLYYQPACLVAPLA